MGLYHPLDGDANLKYKLLCFLTPNKKLSKKKALAFNRERCCHLALCLRLILFHLYQLCQFLLTVNSCNVRAFYKMIYSNKLKWIHSGQLFSYTTFRFSPV
jgi:hypothetical protein